MLRIEAVGKEFSGGPLPVVALDCVNLVIERGEFVTLVGPSGCGKSSLLTLISGLSAPSAGRIRLNGRDITSTDREVGFITQQDNLFPWRTLVDNVALALELAGVSSAERLREATRWIKRVGLEGFEQAYPHQLSGGMRQRAMIAMALACNPKVLIADEPTTALDVTIQAQILEIILELQRKLGTAVILITHDLGVVAETAQRVIVMYAGRKVEEAPVDELFAKPLHPYTHGLLASIPRLGLMRGETDGTDGHLQEIPGMVPALTNLPDGCVFAPRCAHAIDRCRAQYPAYEEKRPGHWAACWRSRELYGAADG